MINYLDLLKNTYLSVNLTCFDNFYCGAGTKTSAVKDNANFEKVTSHIHFIKLLLSKFE